MKKIIGLAIVVILIILIYFVVLKVPMDKSIALNDVTSSMELNKESKIEKVTTLKDTEVKLPKSQSNTDIEVKQTALPQTVVPQMVVPKLSDELERRYAEVSKNEQYPTLALRMSALKNRKLAKHLAPEKVLSLLVQESVWSSIDTPGEGLSLDADFLDDGRVFLNVTTEKFAILLKGDTIGLIVPQLGQTFVTEINTLNERDDSIAFDGKVIELDTGGDVTLNYTATTTSLNIRVEDGEFTMMSTGSDGWILDSALVFE